MPPPLSPQAFGPGPTTVHAHYAGPNTIVVLLEQTLTAAERNLVALGEQDRLRESRLIAQRTLEDRLRDTVETTLGRRAIAVMGAIDIGRDVCAEVLHVRAARRLERRVDETGCRADRITSRNDQRPCDRLDRTRASPPYRSRVATRARRPAPDAAPANPAAARTARRPRADRLRLRHGTTRAAGSPGSRSAPRSAAPRRC